MLWVLFFKTLKDFARKTENLEESSQCSRSLCSLNFELLARALAGFASQGRGDMAGGGMCVTTDPCPLLLVPTADTLQLCPAERQTWVCLSVPRVPGLGCDGH